MTIPLGSSYKLFTDPEKRRENEAESKQFATEILPQAVSGSVEDAQWLHDQVLGSRGIGQGIEPPDTSFIKDFLQAWGGEAGLGFTGIANIGFNILRAGYVGAKHGFIPGFDEPLWKKIGIHRDLEEWTAEQNRQLQEYAGDDPVRQKILEKLPARASLMPIAGPGTIVAGGLAQTRVAGKLLQKMPKVAAFLSSNAMFAPEFNRGKELAGLAQGRRTTSGIDELVRPLIFGEQISEEAMIRTPGAAITQASASDIKRSRFLQTLAAPPPGLDSKIQLARRILRGEDTSVKLPSSDDVMDIVLRNLINPHGWSKVDKKHRAALRAIEKEIKPSWIEMVTDFEAYTPGARKTATALTHMDELAKEGRHAERAAQEVAEAGGKVKPHGVLLNEPHSGRSFTELAASGNMPTTSAVGPMTGVQKAFPEGVERIKPRPASAAERAWSGFRDYVFRRPNASDGLAERIGDKRAQRLLMRGLPKVIEDSRNEVAALNDAMSGIAADLVRAVDAAVTDGPYAGKHPREVLGMLLKIRQKGMKPRVVEALPDDLRKAFVKATTFIDDLSNEAVGFGLVGKENIKIFRDNANSYLRRAVAAYRDPKFYSRFKKRLRKGDPDTVNAYNDLLDSIRKSQNPNLRISENLPPEMSEEEVVRYAEKLLRKGEEARRFRNKQIESVPGGIADPMFDWLQKRGKVAVAYRKALGFNEDFLTRFWLTGQVLIPDLANSHAQQKLVNELASIGALSGQPSGSADILEEGWKAIRIGAGQTEREFFVLDEVAPVLQGLEGVTRRVSEMISMQSLAWLSKMSGWWKYGKTVASPFTGIRNYLGNYPMLLMNGDGLRPELMRPIAHSFGPGGYSWNVIGNGAALDDAARAMETRLKMLGLSHTDLYSGEMRMFAESAGIGDKRAIENFYPETLGEHTRSTLYKLKGGTERFYAEGDVLYKRQGVNLIAPEFSLYRDRAEQFGDLDLWKEVYGTDDPLEIVSEMLKDTTQFYPRVSQLYKDIGKSPISGTFVSFTYEAARNSWNSMRYLGKEIKMAIGAKDPMAKAFFAGRAYRRALGTYMVVNMPGDVVKPSIEYMFDTSMTPEQEAAFDFIGVPEWADGSMKVFLENKSGKVKFAHFGSVDYHDVIRKNTVLAARLSQGMMEGKPVDEEMLSLASSLAAELATFEAPLEVGIETFTNMQSGGDLFSMAHQGFTQTELRKVSDDPTMTGQVKDRLSRATRKLTPTLGVQVFDMMKHIKDRDLAGATMELLPFTQVYEVDLNQRMYGYAAEFSRRRNQITGELSKTVRQGGDWNKVVKKMTKEYEEDFFPDLQKVYDSFKLFVPSMDLDRAFSESLGQNIVSKLSSKGRVRFDEMVNLEKVRWMASQ